MLRHSLPRRNTETPAQGSVFSALVGDVRCYKTIWHNFGIFRKIIFGTTSRLIGLFVIVQSTLHQEYMLEVLSCCIFFVTLDLKVRGTPFAHLCESVTVYNDQLT